MSEQYVDMSEIIRALSGLLGRFAVRLGRRGEDENGVIYEKAKDDHHFALSFVTEDRINVIVAINVQDMLQDYRQYLDNMMTDVISCINEKRSQRMRQLAQVVRAH